MTNVLKKDNFQITMKKYRNTIFDYCFFNENVMLMFLSEFEVIYQKLCFLMVNIYCYQFTAKWGN